MMDPCGPNGNMMSPEDLEELSKFVLQQEHDVAYAVDWELSQPLTHPHLQTGAPAPLISHVKQDVVYAAVQRSITNAQLKEWETLTIAIEANLVLHAQKAQNLEGPAYD